MLVSQIFDKYLVLYENESDKVIYNMESKNIFRASGSFGDIKDRMNDNTLNEQPHYSKETVKKSIGAKDTLASVTFCSTEVCNLRCKYCYANEGTYNSNNQIMNFEFYKKFFHEILKIYPKGIINYTFFGGEPMLGFKDIVTFVKYVRYITGENELVTPHFGIVTNGTLIDEDAWDFFYENNFTITISIDGPKLINDKMRVFEDPTKSVHDTITKNLKKAKSRVGLIAAEATLSDFYFRTYKKGDAREYLDSFYQLGFDTVAPYFAEIAHMNYDEDDELKSGVRQFYYDVTDYYFDFILDDLKYSFVPNFVLSSIINIIKHKSKKACSAGKNSIFITNSGDIYPCQMYYSNKFKMIGNINQVEDVKSSMDNYSVVTRNDIKECRECFAYSFCALWCAGGAYQFRGSEETISPIRCMIQKAIGERIIYNLAMNDGVLADRKHFIQNISKLSKRYSVDNFIGAI